MPIPISPGEGHKIIILRELTKIYEEVISGHPSELLQFFKENPEKQKGEFVVIVPPKMV